MINEKLDFCLEPDYLNNLAEKYHQKYVEAKPYPHIIIDNFLPERILDKILDEFPSPQAEGWRRFERATEKKLDSLSELNMGEFTRFLLYQLNSSIFIDFLEQLTGIQGIIPDPHFQGGGLHQIERGGFLKIHVDFNKHKKMNVDRRLNLLIYLNKNWQEEYGGHFEMWDEKVTVCHEKILPIFNRCVIFSTSDFSYHGHPDPLNCPEGMNRKSLALYYYSNGRPSEEVAIKQHSTLFQERPDENLTLEPSKVSKNNLIQKLVPPIMFDVYRNIFQNK
ncbi:MAG TPA: proline hydroxylase [Cyanothece sp. UBA12306]|nr:proline hydroxylase [Cyanothece sp. UBA12306]